MVQYLLVQFSRKLCRTQLPQITRINYTYTHNHIVLCFLFNLRAERHPGSLAEAQLLVWIWWVMAVWWSSWSPLQVRGLAEGPPPQSILHWLVSGSCGWVTVSRRPLTTSLWKSILVHTRVQPNPHSVGALSFQVHLWPHSMTSPEGPQKLREADGRLCSASPLPGAFIPECKVPFAHTARQKLAALSFITEQYTA